MSKSDNKLNENPTSLRKDPSPNKMQCNFTTENNSEHFLPLMLTDTRLGSALETELGIHLKPGSSLTSRYLITAEQKSFENQCVILQLQNCTSQAGGERIWVKMPTQSRMVLRFPCTAFKNMSFFLFTVQYWVYSFHSLFKSRECMLIGSK